MTVRRATAADLDALAAFPLDDPVGGIDAARLRAEHAAHRLRPEWTWVAEQDGAIVGRALWWGRSDDAAPVALDCLHVRPGVPDRAGLAHRLLTAGHAALAARPRYELTLPGGRRDRPDVVAAVAWRTDAARRAGPTVEVERLRYEWTPDAPVPPPSTRLAFRPEPDDEVFVDAFRRVAAGSLDVATRREVADVGAERQARDDLEFYRGCPGDREWWRLAHTLDGALAGFAVPSATPYGRNVGYLGVVPGMRGRGFVDDVLGEVTRIHAADGAEWITATTDVVNAPMAAAFGRAGYRATEVRLVIEFRGSGSSG
ncbi:GNAT family N-acetyltransferase [Pseudonocardia abyssalis]|uniref:GNAT family N-acetyltransferase n=1 Tax=Pseudonocardia abyssalis TaxID=2792008 RepID=A0ABS6V0E5_9PSEU|nr:GNAT family N-acetyltransferase [Pseudonocardia abyssalis]MBW0115959.1 GNAT family N-acetyltransferase [Pseudonocardia abyssalis]MBW0137994.1 GNAT family N-acetyltransferase [Pseudonocardia abyssalis]